MSSSVHIATSVSLWYGLFVIVGGIVGYNQAGSLMSLYAGCTSGALAILSSVLCRKGYYNLGLKLLTAVSLALAMVFIKRFQATMTFMPSGFMAINSAFILGLSLVASKDLQESAAPKPRSD